MIYPELDVVYEDNHLLAVNKPAGILVQGDSTGDTTLLDSAKEYLKAKYRKPGDVFLGLCHRLDRPVSGIVLMARTSKALSRINRLFSMSEVQKHYVAITDRQVPQDGRICHWLLKNKQRNSVRVVTKTTGGAKKAITHYRLLARKHGLSLVVLKPETGRSHQLRVGMSSMKAPILGDLRYGGSKKGKHHIYLHAYSLHFEHPVRKKQVALLASLPTDPVWSHFHDFADEINRGMVD